MVEQEITAQKVEEKGNLIALMLGIIIFGIIIAVFASIIHNQGDRLDDLDDQIELLKFEILELELPTLTCEELARVKYSDFVINQYHLLNKIDRFRLEKNCMKEITLG